MGAATLEHDFFDVGFVPGLCLFFPLEIIIWFFPGEVLAPSGSVKVGMRIILITEFTHTSTKYSCIKTCIFRP